MKRFLNVLTHNDQQLLVGTLVLLLLWAAARTEPSITILFYLLALAILVGASLASWAGAMAAICVVGMPLASIVAIPYVPSVSALFAVAIISIAAVFYWQQKPIDTACAITSLRRNPYVIFALLAILIIIATNSLRDIMFATLEHRQWSINLVRYWLGFSALGLLVALNRQNLQSFFDLLPPLGIMAVVLYIPFSEAHRFFEDTYKMCGWTRGVNLGYGSLNPNTLGYLCALLGALSFIRGILSINKMTKFFYISLFWFLVVITVLTHSKSAVLSLLTGIIAIIILPIGKMARIQAGLILVLGISAIFAFVVAKPDAFPCTLKARYAEFLQPPSSWRSGSYSLRLGFAYQSLSSIEHKNNPELLLIDGTVEQPLSVMGQKSEEVLKRSNIISVVKEVISAIEHGDDRKLLYGAGPSAGKVAVYSANGTLNLVGSHNLFIDLFVETGLLGLFVFVASSLAITVVTIKQLSTEHDGKAIYFLISYCAMWVIVLVQENLSGGTQGADWLPLLLGMGAGLVLSGRTDEHILKHN